MTNPSDEIASIGAMEVPVTQQLPSISKVVKSASIAEIFIMDSYINGFSSRSAQGVISQNTVIDIQRY